MYRIIKTDGTELGITDQVTYIKFGANGCFTNAAVEDAIGVAFSSTPYNLFGHDEIEGTDTVIVSQIDGGAAVGSLLETINVLLGVTE